MSDDQGANGAGTEPQGRPIPPAVSPYGVRPEHSRHGGVWVGIVLIAIGALVLFGQFTSIVDVWRLWPLFFVVVGVISVFGPGREPLGKRVATSLGTIAFGLVLLGNTFGYLPWTVWLSVISLWPVLLVAIGIELLGKGLGMTWLRVASSLLVLAAFLYAVFVMTPGTARPWLGIPAVSGSSATFARSVAHDAAVSDGITTVKEGALRLTVRPGSELVAISGRSPRGNTPVLRTGVTSGTADVLVTEPSNASYIIGVERSLDLKLDSAVTWRELAFDVGAVDADIDLSALRVAAVAVKTGASDMRIRLGTREPRVDVSIDGGVTSVTLRVPSSAAVTIDASGGLSSVSAPSAFRLVSGRSWIGDSHWVAEGSGGPTIHVSVKTGLSNLIIQTY